MARKSRRKEAPAHVGLKEHQPLPVHGYVAQSESRVKIVNGNKCAEEGLLRMIEAMAEIPEIDMHWLSIGRTHIEQGFMAINRAVFKPERIRLPEDE